MPNRFTHTFTAGPDHIDVMGHVNNAVWVQWMEAVATAHWMQDAAAEHVERYVWVVTRHEIDYRGNIAQGESVTAETFIPEGPTGARFDRRIDFRNAAGKVIVSARSTWAMLDKETLRLTRVSGRLLRLLRRKMGGRGKRFCLRRAKGLDPLQSHYGVVLRFSDKS